MKRVFAVALIVALIAAAGAVAWVAADLDRTSNTTPEYSHSAETSQDSAEARVETIQYQGEDGKTALQLLEEKADVEMSGSGEMAFVTSINGVKADPQVEFWSLLVNNEPATVGAGQYQTKSTDTITWKLEAIDTNYTESETE